MQQKARLLAADFPGVTIDEILAKLEDPSIEPGFDDWRNCLVFWARPPAAVRDLIAQIQQKLLKAAPRKSLVPKTGELPSTNPSKICGPCQATAYT